MSSAKIRYFNPTQPWMTNIIRKIDAYPDGPIENIEGEDLEDLVVDAFEEARAQRQGYQLDEQLRQTIEKYAISVAKKTYESRGYRVEVRGRPFDLHCRKKRGPSDEIWVEVKGTQEISPPKVILTHGQVQFYQNRYPSTELFVVHSIVVRNGRAFGGIDSRYPRWKVNDASLQPIAYHYRMPALHPPER